MWGQTRPSFAFSPASRTMQLTATTPVVGRMGGSLDFCGSSLKRLAAFGLTRAHAPLEQP